VADKSAEEDVNDLSDTLLRVNNKGEVLGRFAFTAILFDRDPGVLETSVTDAIATIGNHKGSLVRETYWALGAHASIIPGTVAGHNFRQREMWLPVSQYVDLSLNYARREGNRINAHLQQQSLVVLETQDATPYYFNLHATDSPNTFLSGVTGAGKTYTVSLFIDSAQQYNPFTAILDIGGSYQHITKKHGGSYLHMSFGDEQTFKINPFASQHRSKNDLQFLFSFVRVLLTNAGHVPTPQDDHDIYEAVKTARRLRDLDLPEHLMVCLHAWIGDGQYASVFDNEEDTLQLAKFQTFDFQGLELWPQLLEPLLFYIFQRISAIVYDPANRTTYKHLWADEVWRFLTNDTARQYLIAAGKTWRKHNGGIGLVTQSAGDLQQAGLLYLVNEICQTQIFLANPGADQEFYGRTFHFNEREISLFSSLIPKKQIFVRGVGV